MGSLQTELRAKVGGLLDAIEHDPVLARAALGAVTQATEQLGVEIGDNNTEGNLQPLVEGETNMSTMTVEQQKTREHIETEARKAGLKVSFQSDTVMSDKQLRARLREEAAAQGLEVSFDKVARDDEGVIASVFGTKTRAKLITGNVIEFALKLGFVVLAVSAGFWILKKVVGDAAPALPMAQPD